MTLSQEQFTALKQNGSIPLTIDGVPCFILRADVFRRVQPFIEYDDAEIAPESTYPAVLDAWNADGDERDTEDYRQ